MKNLFYKSNLRRSNRLKYKIETQKYNQVSYGEKSLRVLGPKIWNILQNDIRSSISLHTFKSNMKHWGGKNCPKMATFYANTESLQGHI